MADLVKVICVIVKESLHNTVRFSIIPGIGRTVSGRKETDLILVRLQSEEVKRINYF